MKWEAILGEFDDGSEVWRHLLDIESSINMAKRHAKSKKDGRFESIAKAAYSAFDKLWVAIQEVEQYARKKVPRSR